MFFSRLFSGCGCDSGWGERVVWAQSRARGSYKQCQCSSWCSATCSGQGKCHLTPLLTRNWGGVLSLVVTVMTLKWRPAWSVGAVCPWCEEEIVVFKHVWCITVWFPPLFPLVSDAEVWGPFALIQDSSPCPLYVTTLIVYFTLPWSAQAFMTHCFITKASAAAVTQAEESGQQVAPVLSIKLIKGRWVSALKTHKAWRVDPRALDSLTHSINDHLLGLGTGMQINKHVITNMIISTSSKKGWWKYFVRSHKVSLQS